MQGLYCTHALQHQYPSSGAAEPQNASTQESKPVNGQSDCSRETKGQWRTTNPLKHITQVTTARRPDNTCSSALVRSQSTKFRVNPCCELRSRYSKIGSHFHHFPAVLSKSGHQTVFNKNSTLESQSCENDIQHQECENYCEVENLYQISIQIFSSKYTFLSDLQFYFNFRILGFRFWEGLQFYSLDFDKILNIKNKISRMKDKWWWLLLLL